MGPRVASARADRYGAIPLIAPLNSGEHPADGGAVSGGRGRGGLDVASLQMQARTVAASTGLEWRPCNHLAGRTREVTESGHPLDRVASATTWGVAISVSPGSGSHDCSAEACRCAEDRRPLILGGRAAGFEHDIPLGVMQVRSV